MIIKVGNSFSYTGRKRVFGVKLLLNAKQG
jgi:hypothetical protein